MYTVGCGWAQRISLFCNVFLLQYIDTTNMVCVILTEALSEYGHKDVCDITPVEIAAQVTCVRGWSVCTYHSTLSFIFVFLK